MINSDLFVLSISEILAGQSCTPGVSKCEKELSCIHHVCQRGRVDLEILFNLTQNVDLMWTLFLAKNDLEDIFACKFKLLSF